MSRARSTGVRRVAEVATNPAIVGAAYVLAVVAAYASGPVFNPSDRSLGKDTGSAVKTLVETFPDVIRDMTIAIGASAVAIGAAFGLFAWALVAARAAMLRSRRGTLARGVAALVIVAVVHALALMREMALAPQLFDKLWYRKRGWERAVVLAATEVGPRAIVAVGAALALAYALGLPGTLRGARRSAALTTARRAAPRAIAIVTGIAAIATLRFAAVRLGERSNASPSDRPNVVILAADSLRFDRLTPLTAPALSAAADRGARFQRDYTALPRTFSAWANLLTGRWPHHHGIRSLFARWEERARDLDALPTHLARAGYRTSVVSDFAGENFRLADFGFQTIQTPTLSARETVRRGALERAAAILPFVASPIGRMIFPAARGLHEIADPDVLADEAIHEICRRDERPFFLTVFFSTAHFPYAAPWPYYRLRTLPDYVGAYKFQKDMAFTRDQMTRENVTQVRGLYDGAVASIDASAARVLAALQRCGLDKSTIVVITADHGEMLYDNGHDHGHGDTLFGDEVLHVPLAIYDPRIALPHRFDGIVRDIDLAPTLYDLTGVAPPRDLDGASLALALRGQDLAPRLAFAETEVWLTEGADTPPGTRLPYPTLGRLVEIDHEHGDQIVLRREVVDVTVVARHRMVRDDRYKLIFTQGRAAPQTWLFDTANDPAELHDVKDQHPDVAALLTDTLWKWMLEDPQLEKRDGWLVMKTVPDGWAR